MVNFDEPCDYFTVGKAKASTLSLSVLVAIEMFNALNALSEVNNRHSRIHLSDILQLHLDVLTSHDHCSQCDV